MQLFISKPQQWREILHGIVANVLDYDILVNKFELLSCYYVHVPTNILEKDMNSFILPAMG